MNPSSSVTRHKRRETARPAEKNMEERENYENIQKFNYVYVLHLEIIFGTQLASYDNTLCPAIIH